MNTNTTGSWVIVDNTDWTVGDVIDFTTPAGTVKRVHLADSTSAYGSTAWLFVPTDAPVTASTPAPKPRTTGWAAARGGQDTCPTCGEIEMYDHGVCDECGHQEKGADPTAEKAAEDAAEDAHFKRREEREAKEQTKQSTLAEVAAAFDALREAETDTEELSAKATEVINRAQEEGEDIVRIAEAAGINRNNVYKRLKAGAPSITVVTRDLGEITGTSLEAAILRTYGPRARATKHADPNAPTWGMITARTALDRNAAHVLDEIISVDGRYS